MPKDGFTFKKFSVKHDRCAMKVGTDGVLLGAWADVSEAHHILDVGTGCGLVALMVAQRCDARIVGIDIDKRASEQAFDNFVKSPWHNRLRATHIALHEYEGEAKFDHLISNPPFYDGETWSPDAGRSMARHTQSLPFEVLIMNAYRLLMPSGLFQLILPSKALTAFLWQSEQCGFSLSRLCHVIPKEGGEAKRVLIGLRKGMKAEHVAVNKLVLRDADGRMTQAYADLTSEYYL